MNQFSFSRAHLNEQRVAAKLKKLGYNVKALNARKAYDITGYIKENPILIEVKERSKLWEDQFLQVSKVNSLLKHRDRILKKFPQFSQVRLSYIMSFENDDYIFNVDQIANCKTETLLMNKATVENEDKVFKEVYIFPLSMKKAKV